MPRISAILVEPIFHDGRSRNWNEGVKTWLLWRRRSSESALCPIPSLLILPPFGSIWEHTDHFPTTNDNDWTRSSFPAPIFCAAIATSLPLCERADDDDDDDDDETGGVGERPLVRFGDKWVSGIVIGNSFIFASHQSERQRLLQTRNDKRRRDGWTQAVMTGQVTKFNVTAGQGHWTITHSVIFRAFRREKSERTVSAATIKLKFYHGCAQRP